MGVPGHGPHNGPSGLVVALLVTLGLICTLSCVLVTVRIGRDSHYRNQAVRRARVLRRADDAPAPSARTRASSML